MSQIMVDLKVVWLLTLVQVYSVNEMFLFICHCCGPFLLSPIIEMKLFNAFCDVTGQ